ncbi:MAG: glycosyltransferase family 2 protein [Nocardiaceae bacterium]|nr:glycosyltransferase family 2 protein [Nocardiaceae bacterium]
MISVVIPVRNGAEVLPRQLAALARQSFSGDWEIVVANNGSTDGTVAVIAEAQRSIANLRVVDASDRPGINHARNVGLYHCLGDRILLCDADDQADPDWLEAMSRAFDSGAELLAGAIKADGPFAAKGTRTTQPTCIFYGFAFLGFPAGANCGFTRRIFHEIGPFDERYVGGGDETDWFWRAQLKGHQLRSVPGAIMLYSTRESLSDLRRQSLAYGRSHVRLFQRFRSSGMPRSYGIRSLIRVGLLLTKSIANSSARAGAIEQISLLQGRLQQSLRSRTWYL